MLCAHMINDVKGSGGIFVPIFLCFDTGFLSCSAGCCVSDFSQHHPRQLHYPISMSQWQYMFFLSDMFIGRGTRVTRKHSLHSFPAQHTQTYKTSRLVLCVYSCLVCVFTVPLA